MENRNIPSPRADTLDTLICGFILGMVFMGMASWLIGAALMGAAGHGDWDHRRAGRAPVGADHLDTRMRTRLLWRLVVSLPAASGEG